MEGVSIEAALSGRGGSEGIGHKLRWAEKFLDLHHENSHQCFQALRDLVSDARAAQALVSVASRLPVEPGLPIAEHLQRLQAHGESFPTTLKVTIMCCFLWKNMQEDNFEKVTVAVWPVHVKPKCF